MNPASERKAEIRPRLPAVYLAGKMAGCSDEECHGWRNLATILLPGLDVRNPMVRDFRGVDLTAEECRQLVADDKLDIDQCFAVIVRADGGASWGTAMETIYAYSENKYVVAFVGNSTVSPWVIAHAHKIVRTIEEACAAVLLERRLGRV